MIPVRQRFCIVRAKMLQATTLLSSKVSDQCLRNNLCLVLFHRSLTSGSKVGVPGYRVSQMVAAGGNILDAYGLVNVVSPSGLPIRGIVGISPDPIMLVAINCKDVQKSKAFYEQLGFMEQVC
jgi:hypothetical protein